MSSAIAARRIAASDYAGRGKAFADLSARAEAPNPHMAPAAVAAALESGVASEDIVVILAHEAARLLGVWVLHRERSLRTGFASLLTAPLIARYGLSSAPVLDKDRAADAALALLQAIIEAQELPKRLSLPLLPMQGSGFAALQGALAASGSTLSAFERWQRPMLLPAAGETAEHYLRRAFGAGYKKRMQQHRQLRKTGALALRRLRGVDVAAGFAQFAALEAAGWKGRRGTALACLPQDRDYVRRLLAGFAACDAARVDLLECDGRPIAAGLLLEVAGTSWFLKIAYDETMARFSPGRALAIEMLCADFAAGLPFRLDSGAGDAVDPGAYPWAERLAMAHAIVALAGRTALPPRLAAGARMRLRRWRERRSA
jgi:CelD/BcsL family acetyltransferase involved in cellulose biosynthesis